MRDEDKTTDQLIYELEYLRRKLAEERRRRIFLSPRLCGGETRELSEADYESIADEKARAESIIAAIGDGIRILNRDFMIVYENGPHKELLGDHIGEYCYRAYRQRDVECEMCPLAVTFDAGLVHKAERSLSLHTGTKHLDITASPLRNGAGNIIAAIIVVRDITDRKLIQAENENLIAELQRALASIKTLKGLIPTCAWCGKVKNEKGYWNKLEHYIRDNSEANFSHGICPECLKKNEPEIYEDLSMEPGRKQLFLTEKIKWR